MKRGWTIIAGAIVVFSAGAVVLGVMFLVVVSMLVAGDSGEVAAYPPYDMPTLPVEAPPTGSGVVVNGVELSPAEVAYYEAMIGPIPRGRYWVDGAGNVGREGNPVPLISGGGRGSPQWSGRMSSGTVDRSGGGNSVFSVDGEVLTLP